MAQAQSQFDGQNPVAGYTLFHGKDGQSYYLKGENLPDEEVTRRVSAIRGQQPQPTSGLSAWDEQARGRTLSNLTAAMSGQRMQNPEDQAQAEAGRKAGTIAGGIQIATGALGGAIPALTAQRVIGTQTVGTGILGPEGEELTRQITKYGPSLAKALLSHPLAKSALKWAVAGGASTLVGSGTYKTLKALGVL